MRSGRSRITRCSLHTCISSPTKLRLVWEKHRGEGDGIAGEPYTQAQVLEYWEFCDRMIDDAVDALDLDGSESGFSWYRMSKLEHQLVNIRHIQHHAGQLIDRVRSAADVGIHWVAAR
jgi:hypothetical protein